MLRLPEDSRASGAAEAAATTELAFGFSRHEPAAQELRGDGDEESAQQQDPRKFFGDDAETQLKKLSVNSARLGAELAMLLKLLRASTMEACDVTRQHAEIYRDAIAETGIIVDANLRAAEDIAARTQQLSENLGDLAPLKARIRELEKALTSYERIADKILG